MSADPRRLLAVYMEHRLDDQLRYYRGRVRTHERALAQLGFLSAVVFVASATASALAGNGVAPAGLWAVLAVAFPALATALSAFGALYGFEQEAKLYSDAARVLQRLKRDAPDLAEAADPDEAVRAYVERVEEAFRLEGSRWGQFAAERKPPESRH